MQTIMCKFHIILLSNIQLIQYQPAETEEGNEETYESYAKDTSDFYASDMRDTFEKLCTRCSEKMPPHFINI